MYLLWYGTVPMFDRPILNFRGSAVLVVGKRMSHQNHFDRLASIITSGRHTFVHLKPKNTQA